MSVNVFSFRDALWWSTCWIYSPSLDRKLSPGVLLPPARSRFHVQVQPFYALEFKIITPLMCTGSPLSTVRRRNIAKMTEATEAIVWQLDQYGCVRQDENGYWWSLNKRRQGWSSFGYRYSSIEELEQREHSRVLLDAPQTDRWGTFYQTEKNMSSGFWAG